MTVDYERVGKIVEQIDYKVESIYVDARMELTDTVERADLDALYDDIVLSFDLIYTLVDALQEGEDGENEHELLMEIGNLESLLKQMKEKVGWALGEEFNEIWRLMGELKAEVGKA